MKLTFTDYAGIGDMPFVPPADSLYHRYSQAHRRVTWDRVRVSDKEGTPGGIKVLPPERDQKGLRKCSIHFYLVY